MTPVPKPTKRPKVRKPLKRSGWKRGRSKRSKKSGGRMFAGTRDDTYQTWIRSLPCAVCKALGVRQTTPTEVEHFVHKSHGGKDRGDTYPTCGTHREMRHTKLGPKAFTKMLLAHGLDERALCAYLAYLYEVAWSPS